MSLILNYLSAIIHVNTKVVPCPYLPEAQVMDFHTVSSSSTESASTWSLVAVAVAACTMDLKIPCVKCLLCFGSCLILIFETDNLPPIFPILEKNQMSPPLISLSYFISEEVAAN